MKLAFVAFLPERSPGVEMTLRAKARAFASLGVDVDLFAISDKWRQTADDLISFRPVAGWSTGRLHYPLEVFFRYIMIEKAVALSSYDLVILRYPGADFSGAGFSRRYPVVTEHHSRTVSEMRLASQSASSPVARGMKRVRLGLEQRYGSRMLEKARGLIGVTDEIRLAEVWRAGRELPSITVTNGIDVASVKATGYEPFTGTDLHLAFLASKLTPWHGLDRLIDGLRRYGGDARVTIHLVGEIPETSETTVATRRAMTRHHGTLTGSALDDLLGRVTLAVGSLGVHRKQMTEACNLKTREYMARGLPFILSHDDPDLAARECQRFLLRLPADDEPVDVEAIIEFARVVSAENLPGYLSVAMRDYAARRMDWVPKMKQYADFCLRILEERETDST